MIIELDDDRGYSGQAKRWVKNLSHNLDVCSWSQNESWRLEGWVDGRLCGEYLERMMREIPGKGMDTHWLEWDMGMQGVL